MADVVRLEAFRLRAPAAPQPDKATLHLSCAADKVLLRFGNGDEVDLNPTRARVWAERLMAMADAAEGLARDERVLLGQPEGGDGG